MHFRFCLAFICLFLSFSPWAKFPSRPIKIMVYTKPGGAIDVFSRKFQEIAKKYTDHRFLVVNKPGAGGLIALKKIARGKNDGHVIGAVTKSNIGKILTSKSNLKIESFDWLVSLVSDPEALIVNKNQKINSWKMVLQDAKEKQGDQIWVGPAVGGNDHIMAIKTWDKLGIKAKWIPYAGGGKAMAALLGGHASVYVGNPGDVLGKPILKVIAISSEKRLSGTFQNVPTFKELGLKNFDSEIMWRGFLAKKGMKKEARAFYQDLFKKVSHDPEWRKFISERGATAVYLPGENFENLVKEDYKEFKKILTDLKLI